MSRKGFRIFGKLFLSHSSIGLIAIITVSSIFYIVLRNALIERVLDQLSSINILKKHLVEEYLFRSQLNLEALQVEEKFLHIFHDLRDNQGNADPQDIRDIHNLCKLYDFMNLHIFDTRHHQVFSTDQETYPDGLLTKIDDAISKEPSRIHVIDATIHSPGNRTLLFYYVPIIDQGAIKGIVLVQENFKKIQRILLENTGMGNTGESYLVGDDLRLRSTSRFFPDSIPGLIIAETEAVKRLVLGNEGRGITSDYRGVAVLSAYRVVDNKDLRWLILSEMDEKEAMKPIVQLRNYLLLITLLIVLITILFTYFLSNRIIGPILKLKRVITSLSLGIIPSQRPVIASTDEIGEMAVAIQSLTDGLERTSDFAREIGGGNFEASFTTLSNDDALGKSLISMRDELRNFHERELKSARARAAALLEGQEIERTRIVKELHDGVGQMLTAIGMQVEMLDGNDIRKADVKKYIKDAVTEIKRISYHMMPQAIVDFGLEAALKGLCESIKRYSSLVIDFEYIQDSENKLDFDISIAVYRIVQEGLNNIVKHARANHVNLHLVVKEDELFCLLEDDGIGFRTSDDITNSGTGLRNIKERAMLLDGFAEIQSTPKSGTVLEVHIPLRAEPFSEKKTS